LTGKCYGSPVGFNGKIYIQTEKRLYCFGKKGSNLDNIPAAAPESWPAVGEAKKLQIVPAETFLNPKESIQLKVRSLDAKGYVGQESVDPKSLKWEKFVPPTALVKATMNVTVDDSGHLIADAVNEPSAGQMQATFGELKGYMKGRVLPGIPF